MTKQKRAGATERAVKERAVKERVVKERAVKERVVKERAVKELAAKERAGATGRPQSALRARAASPRTRLHNPRLHSTASPLLAALHPAHLSLRLYALDKVDGPKVPCKMRVASHFSDRVDEHYLTVLSLDVTTRDSTLDGRWSMAIGVRFRSA